MTAANYAACLARVLDDEGGYSNDAGDPGGPTKYGITIIDYRKYIDPNGTAADVRNMTVEQAKQIYAQRYWAVTKGDAEPAGVDYALLDYGVNSGVARAGKVVRRICGLPTDDWHITPDVLAAIAKRDPKTLSDAIWDERLRFLQSLSTWSIFGKGWGSRVRRGKAASQKMTGAAVDVPQLPTGPQGKGEHPKPQVQGPVIAAGGGGAAAAGGLSHWVGAHPVLSVAIAVAIIGLAAWLVSILWRQHTKRQTEPMPGMPVIPEKA